LKTKTKPTRNGVLIRVRPTDFLSDSQRRMYRAYQNAKKHGRSTTAAMKNGWKHYERALRTIYARSRGA
jgi:hypothetical protein